MIIVQSPKQKKPAILMTPTPDTLLSPASAVSTLSTTVPKNGDLVFDEILREISKCTCKKKFYCENYEPGKYKARITTDILLYS